MDIVSARSSPNLAALFKCSDGCALSPKTQRKLNDHVIVQFRETRVLADQALLAPTFQKHSAATVQIVGLSAINGVVLLMFTGSRKTIEKVS